MRTRNGHLRLIGLALFLALCTAGPAGASPPSTTEANVFAAKAPLIPPSFQLKGSNGYSIFVLAIPPRAGNPGRIQIAAVKDRMGAVYSTNASVSETSIAADLGALGRISVNFHPDAQGTTKLYRCGRQQIPVAVGSYEGTIAFHGEGGYTEVEATAVPADIRPLLAFCGFDTGSVRGPSPAGAELFVRNPQLGPQLTVVKATPSAPARFFVDVSEYVAGVSIRRFASPVMPSNSFQFSANLQTATIRPPPPFAGAAHFDRRKKANRRWSGNLTIDMPGLPQAPLTGPQLRAFLALPNSAGGDAARARSLHEAPAGRMEGRPTTRGPSHRRGSRMRRKLRSTAAWFEAGLPSFVGVGGQPFRDTPTLS